MSIKEKNGLENELEKMMAEIEVDEPPKEKPVDSTITVMISADSKAAFIKMTMPMFGGKPILEEDIREKLNEKGVVFGINEEYLVRYAKKPVYNISLKIASALEAQAGKDGEITYHYDTSDRIQLKERDDGSIDFKDLDFVKNVTQGTMLASATKGEAGINGTDVLGNTIVAIEGKTPDIKVGKNTVLSEDGLILYADSDGKVEFKNGQYEIDDVLTIKTDVGLSTGNIEFLGDIVIHGDVREGYEVRSINGSIVVKGSVEPSSNIEAAKNIQIAKGVNSMKKGLITAGCDVKIKFIENAIIKAGGSIYADSLLHSEVEAGDSVVLSGDRGVLIGGSCRASKKIEAKTIGTSSNFLTVLELYTKDDFDQTVFDMTESLEDKKIELQKVEKIVKEMTNKILAATKVDDKTRQIHLIAKEKEKQLKSEIKELTAQFKELQEKEKVEERQKIVAKSTLYEGVKITINTVTEVLAHTYDKVAVYQDGGEFIFSID